MYPASRPQEELILSLAYIFLIETTDIWTLVNHSQIALESLPGVPTTSCGSVYRIQTGSAFAMTIHPPTSEREKISILSLPNELLIVVLSLCDNSSLLGLAQTCRDLNAMALRTFFDQNQLIHPAGGSAIGYMKPKATLDAIRIAFSAKELRLLTWYFNPGFSHADPNLEDAKLMWDGPAEPKYSNVKEMWGAMGPLKRTLDEIDKLRLLVARFQAIAEVCLEFSVLDRWLDDSRLPSAEKIDPSVLGRKFSRLLDDLLVGGCEELRIDGGGMIVKRLFSTSQDGQETHSQSTDGMFVSCL